jgi:quinoprotein glucose dehydrogenase
MKRILLLAICAGIALVNARAQTGDVAAGERLFAGKGNCTNCHMVRGRGGILGPDLSDIGRERTSAQIEQALRAPGSASSYPAVTVHLRTGQTIHGIAKNESAFELQVLDMDGKLHLLSKERVTDIVREKSLMPKLAWTSNEMRDLVSYLSRLIVDPNA